MTETHQVSWATGRGLSIPAARHVRLVADGGELWLHDSDAEPRLLGTAASLTRAHPRTHSELRSLRRWPADPADESLLRQVPASGVVRRIEAERDRQEALAPSGALVLSGPDGPVITVPLLDVVPPGAPASDALRASGAAALVRALGLTLQEGPPLDRTQRAAESRVLLRPQRRQLRLARLVWTMAVVSVVIVLVALQAGVDWPAWPHAVACLLAVAATAGLVRSRLAFRRLTRTPLEAAGRSVYDVPGGVAGTQVQFGRDDVVIVRPYEAQEIWLRGPATGGVALVELGAAQVHLRDAEGALLAGFDTAELVPATADADRLRACCETAGIEVTAGRLDAEVGTGATTPLRPIDGRAGWELTERESGALGLSVPIVCGLAAVLGLVAPLGPGAKVDAFGWLLVAAGVACVLAVLWGAVSQQRWRRSVGRDHGQYEQERAR
ncbi:hypothetical protein [Mumia zhuanghuii]|uniref:hypothetical protein n=1 Tax=Mumia zhuanghuii TaxID=2585211 RepID=UPI00363C46EB